MNVDGLQDLTIQHVSAATYSAQLGMALVPGNTYQIDFSVMGLTNMSFATVQVVDCSGNILLVNTSIASLGNKSFSITIPSTANKQSKLIITLTRNAIATSNITIGKCIVQGKGYIFDYQKGPEKQHYLNIVRNKDYELANHLGNVLNVITDRKLGVSSNSTNPDLGTIANYTADVVSYSDYCPFGVELDNRHGAEDERYRRGFQGQLLDDEIKGEGNSVNYKYRMHDPRIGRFFAIDPLAPKYPKWSPYVFSGNQVIVTIELEGLEPEVDGTASGEVQAAIHKEKDDWRMWQWQPLNGDPNSKYGWADISEFNPFKMVDGTILNLPKDAQVLEITLKSFDPVYENGVEVGRKIDQYRVVKFKIGTAIYHQAYIYTGRNMNRTPDYNGIWDDEGNKFSNNLTEDGKYAGDSYCTNPQTLVSDKVCLNTKLNDEAWAAYIREARNNTFSDLFLDWVIKEGGGGDNPQGPIDFWSSHDNYVDKQVKLALMLSGPGSYAYIKEGLMEFDNDYGNHYRVYFFKGYNSKTNEPIFAPIQHKTIQMVSK